MRSIKRLECRFPILSDKGLGGKAAQRNESRQLGEPVIFPDHWNHPEVRGGLLAMQGWRCAFCDGPLPEKGRGDVEHFRPKQGVAEDPHHGGYWWLAYDFANYLLSCDRCNREQKRNHFPLMPGCLRATWEQRLELALERPMLLDPGSDAIEDLISLVIDDSGTLAHFAPAQPLGVHTERVETTLNLFKINTQLEMFKEIGKAMDALTVAGGDLEHFRMRSSRYRHYGFIYRALLKLWYPSLVPGLEEEFSWHLEAILTERDLAFERLAQYPQDAYLARYFETLNWALAALWRDPPVWTREVIARLLDREGLIAVIRPYFNQLET